MKISIQDGTRYQPKDCDEVRCETHGVVTTWGDLDAIQQLALSEGSDTAENVPCILLPEQTARAG